MVIRIRFGKGPVIARKKGGAKRNAALTLAVLLTPASAAALALCFWRIAADLHWTGSFAIGSGIFSHWHTWLALAVVLQVCSRMLSRYARNSDAPAA